MQYSLRWALCAALIGLAPHAAADEVRLKDGTVLLGSMGTLSEGTLQFEASFGGTLSIPWEQVATLQTDRNATFILKDGKQATGTLSVVDGAHMLGTSPPERAPLALGEVASIQTEAPAPPEDAPAPPPAEAPASPDLWMGRAELGLNGQSGNKERFDVRAGIDMNRKAEQWRLNLYLKGQYAETNSERSANEVMTGTRAEWDINDRTYVFGKIDLEHDEFEDLELRATLTAGLGHFFVKREKIELKGWLGAGYEHETFEKDPEPIPADLPEPTTLAESMRRIELLVRGNEKIVSTMNETVAELGYSYRQDLKRNFRFNHGVTYYPSVDDPFGEFRIAADTALEFPVGKDPLWTLRAGVRNEFDARPQDDVDRLDTTYYLNLGYNW